ncbi:uncharacterized protein LOC117648212 isoform X2 [Thrips palmi]|nr:uncharacterized protein LOC117648212 isoform X2 [Thrips palmi]
MQLDRMGSEHCDVHFELTSSSNRLTGFRLKIHRCVLGKPSDCEYFNTWAWNMPVCKLMYSDNMVWTPLVHNLDPVFKCPILSGDYFGRNTTLDFEALERMIGGLNLDKYAWPVKVMLDGDQGLFICFDFIAEVRRVKVREHR